MRTFVMEKGRREFLKQAAMATGGAGLMHLLPDSLVRAMAIDPAKGSTYLDAEHVVFLMQENRSFDHTFGTLQGVRGFDDPRAIDLPDGRPVWLQSSPAGDTYAPFRLDMHRTRATWMSSLPHSWPNQVDARNNGRYDQWLSAKTSANSDYKDMPLTLGYHNREDIPFYYALADAFTVCDHNFCSSLTGTTPNRLFFWSGTIRERQDAAAIARIYNSDADYGNTVNWKTFPERLQEAGVPWRIYQNEISAGTGLEGEADAWLGNFTDNALEFFAQYNVKLAPEYIANLPHAEKILRAAIADKEGERGKMAAKSEAQLKAASELAELQRALEQNLVDRRECTMEKFQSLSASEKEVHQRAFTNNRNDPDYHSLENFTYNDSGQVRELQIPKGDVLYQFREDVKAGKLPTVSWLVAPENFSDHPSAAWFGSWYISEVMKILTDNPEVWKKTIFVVTYDENDGYFDHVPPFVPPHPHNEQTGRCSGGISTETDYVIGAQQQSSVAKDVRSGPIGLGYRVPMIIASPWTRGGWVNSQVFDHTSSLRFLEKFLLHKTGTQIRETNISTWRRTICGDLTSVFREYNGEKIRFPEPVVRKKFIREIHEAQFKKLPDDFQKQDATNKNRARPRLQETGTRPANALPCQAEANIIIDSGKKRLQMVFNARTVNGISPDAGIPFTVYNLSSYNGAAPLPRYYAVAAGESVTDDWNLPAFDTGDYHLRVYGPNGFFREFRGAIHQATPTITMLPANDGSCRMSVLIKNAGSGLLELEITDRYRVKENMNIRLNSDEQRTIPLNLSSNGGWHDINMISKGSPRFMARYAGRIENGKHGITDPFMGGIEPDADKH